MKKIVMIMVMLLGSVGFLSAQEIMMAKASIDKAERNCVIGKYNMTESVVSDALAAKLKESGLTKSNRAKGGFRVYQGVSIPEISNDKIDLYTNVIGDKSNATVYLAASSGYDNFFTPESDPEVINKLKAYLQSMLINVNVAQIKVDIAEQAKVVNKADKENEDKIKVGKSLVDDQKNLEQKIVENKKSQETNKKEQEETAQKLKGEQAALSELKSKLQMMLTK